ncbi:MAG TPA: metallophosphoesterase [Solirubrobacteraceae bacterium]|nr:metallophosphoesterase [Solirubrobacteraceae bacterium]
MRTLIVSDLHLGSLSRSDLLRRPEIRAQLIEALADVDRLVLLGDVLELRHGPLRDALAAARPFFEDLGSALAGRELLLTAGNHDHALVEPWLARRGEEREPPPLELEQLIEPRDASPAIERIAEWSAPARVRVAYPGVWVRPDVYAIHGHYLDSHLTVPTLERLSVGAMSRLLGRPPASFESVGDYEAVGAPIFAWRDAISRDTRTGSALNGLATVAAWRALGGVDGASAGDDGGRGRGRDRDRGRGRGAGALASRRRAAGRRLRARALIGSFPLAVAALNRAGLGPLRADISPGELRRAGLRAMGEVSARLGLADAHVVFGHTHRAGPLAGDREDEWRGPDGARLVNAGSWTYSEVFVTAKQSESPYWPGACVLVGDDGPPQLRRLLQDRSQAELKPAPRER